MPLTISLLFILSKTPSPMIKSINKSFSPLSQLITSYEYEIISVFDIVLDDIWFADYAFEIASEFGQFGLDVSDGPGDGKSPG